MCLPSRVGGARCSSSCSPRARCRLCAACTRSATLRRMCSTTGTANDGTTYLVQEFVPGAPMQTLTDAYLDQLFALNDLQANLNPHPEANALESWSGYVYEVVFARTSVWVRRWATIRRRLPAC